MAVISVIPKYGVIYLDHDDCVSHGPCGAFLAAYGLNAGRNAAGALAGAQPDRPR